MNENKSSCAPTDQEQDKWKSINWNKCQVEVRKLQARIVKAQKEGKHGKVKSLQWILTLSDTQLFVLRPVRLNPYNGY